MANNSVLQGLAANCRLQYVKEPEPAVFGVFDNFGVVVKYLVSERQYIILVSAGATSNEAVNGMVSSLNQFAAERKRTINYTSYLDKVVTISVRDMGKNTIPALQEAVGAATYFCNQFGFIPVCKYCGNQMDLGFFAIGGTVDTMCTQCFNRRQAETSNMAMAEANKQFNLPMGILGAVLGAFIGGLIWVVTYQLGFLLFITGAVIVFLSCMLLKKMGGKFTVGGLITALVVSLAMVFVSEYLAVGINIFTQGGAELGLSFGDSFKFLNRILFDSSLSDVGYGMSSAIKEFKTGMTSDMIYGLMSYIVAAVLFIINYIKEKKVKYQAVRIG
ncbi:hypothetical protein [Candidatus Pseudoruminococcus sp.]|uniref:hypothetical protein n=1 Tax=Candidatus Pseudoruminococcus sp. TaxID=3101048 RepID=UPI00399A82C9